MKRAWCIMMAAGAVVGLAGQGRAQTQAQGYGQAQGYTTRLYKEAPTTAPDPNYGLPAFALPGYEAPRPKATTPEANGLETTPGTNGPEANLDFYKPTPESRFTLPRQTAKAGSFATETPLYTTQEGLPAEDTMRSDTMEPDAGESDTLGGYPRPKR